MEVNQITIQEIRLNTVNMFLKSKINKHECDSKYLLQYKTVTISIIATITKYVDRKSLSVLSVESFSISASLSNTNTNLFNEQIY